MKYDINLHKFEGLHKEECFTIDFTIYSNLTLISLLCLKVTKAICAFNLSNSNTN